MAIAKKAMIPTAALMAMLAAHVATHAQAVGDRPPLFPRGDAIT